MRGAVVAVPLALVLGWGSLSPSADARVFGQKKQGIKGRYVEVEKGVSLADYRGALVVLEATEIAADQDRPEDLDFVRKTSIDYLKYQLESSGLFAGV